MLRRQDVYDTSRSPWQRLTSSHRLNDVTVSSSSAVTASEIGDAALPSKAKHLQSKASHMTVVTVRNLQHWWTCYMLPARMMMSRRIAVIGIRRQTACIGGPAHGKWISGQEKREHDRLKGNEEASHTFVSKPTHVVVLFLRRCQTRRFPLTVSFIGRRRLTTVNTRTYTVSSFVNGSGYRQWKRWVSCRRRRC